MKLKSITFAVAPRIPGVRPGDLGTIDCLNPTTPMRGWRVFVKGSILLLVSPLGWKSGKNPREWDRESGLYQMYEIPRANCYLQWESNDSNIDATMKTLAQGFVSDTFGKPFDASEFEQPKAAQKPVNPAELGDA